MFNKSTENKIMSTILLLIVFLLNVVLVSKFHCDIRRPSSLFVLFWIANIAISFILLSSQNNNSHLGLSYLLLAVDVFVLSFNSVSKNHLKQYNIFVDVLSTKIFTFTLILSLLAGFAYVLMELSNNGFRISEIRNGDDIKEIGEYFTKGRYGTSIDINISLFEQICLTINYAGFVIFGYGWNLKIINKYCWFVLFAPMIFTAVATTAKTTFVCSIFLWICGYLVGANVNKNRKKIINLLNLFFLAIVFIVVFYLSFVVRYGDDSSFILDRILIYAIGHTACFDYWFDNFDANLFGYSYGQQVFMALWGIQKPEALAEVYISPIFESEYGWTNVITLFAYVIMDYGLIGGIVFFVLFGIISGLSYNSLMKSGSSVGHACTGLTFFIILYSFLVSPFRYMSIIGAFILFGIYIFIYKRIYAKRFEHGKAQ